MFLLLLAGYPGFTKDWGSLSIGWSQTGLFITIISITLFNNSFQRPLQHLSFMYRSFRSRTNTERMQDLATRPRCEVDVRSCTLACKSRLTFLVTPRDLHNCNPAGKVPWPCLVFQPCQPLPPRPSILLFYSLGDIPMEWCCCDTRNSLHNCSSCCFGSDVRTMHGLSKSLAQYW